MFKITQTGESGAMRPCGSNRTRAHSRKAKNDRKLLLDQQLSLSTKQISTKKDTFLDFVFPSYSFIHIFHLTIKQDKKYLAFFGRKKI